jgi:hypothetical protein
MAWRHLGVDNDGTSIYLANPILESIAFSISADAALVRGRTTKSSGGAVDAR